VNATETPLMPLMIDIREASRITRISVRSLWRMIAASAFVPPVRLSSRIVRFRLADVSQWIDRHATGGIQ